MKEQEFERVLWAIMQIRCNPSATEEELHVQLLSALDAAGLCPQHEVRLAPRCRIDVMCGGIGIEIKKKRPVPSALRAQLERYAACVQVERLVVVAPRSVNLPWQIGGKPVHMVGLERLWGVSLP